MGKTPQKILATAFAAPSQTLSGAHPPIVVIRESGLTIIELELVATDCWVPVIAYTEKEVCYTK